jgi:UDP-4-amino-4-deoxy-L-arabinose formyltransferase/UDP-glucuronic acid dehydrogenase (UDP-4-keto-hexauronic acid decarboxylating)
VLSDADTGLTASLKCVRASLPLIVHLLRLLSEGLPVPAVEQDHARRRYYSRKVPHGGWVPWSTSGRQCVDFVRACDYTPFDSPWGLARTAVLGAGPTEVEVVRAATTGRPTTDPPGTVGRQEGNGVLVAAADEWVLLQRTQVDGRRTPPPDLFRLGDRLVVPPNHRTAGVARGPMGSRATSHCIPAPSVDEGSRWN